MKMGLVVGVEAVLAALDPRDVMNLQWALIKALYTANDPTFELALQDAGATLGTWAFPMPLGKPTAVKDRLFRLNGLMTLEVNSDTLTV